MSLAELQKEVERLKFVVVVLVTELRRVGGDTPALSYLQQILAPQAKGSVVDSKQNEPRREG